ncbi:acyltransferase [Teredinibacter franksiae]|uniref:acyltransferase n=1 Tax=Teredinibacter franksiae TaxID=2761453 RepID=UPI0016273245
MRKNHTPLFVKSLQRKLNRWLVEKKLRPQFDKLGVHPAIHQPPTVQITGCDIEAGDYLHIISNRHQPVTLTSWRSKQQRGYIHIGHYCLISPGVQLAAAQSIMIGNNCMLAAEVTISDCDWHGTYNRIRPFRCTSPVTLADNVWVGLRTIICKGVSIGENSIIGAGSVVTHNIPANVIAAGNPAKIVKHINPKRRMLKREFLFQNSGDYWQTQEELERAFNANNRFFYWLKTLIWPSQKD